MTRAGILAAFGSIAAVCGTWVGWRDDVRRDPVAGAAIDGSTLFRSKGCAVCHDGPDSSSDFDSSFPSLANAPDWAGERGSYPSARAYLVESILAPSAYISPVFTSAVGPLDAMPDLGLTAAEANNLADYLLDRDGP